MKKDDISKPPQPTAGDTAHLVAQSILSIVPGAAELFEYFISPPLEKRRQQWMEEVGQVLHDLEANRGIKIEELQSNDDFVDTVLHITQIALRNTREEKRTALRNALTNAALPNPIEQSMQAIFLGFIDVFTVLHIQILELFHEPANQLVLKDYGHRKELIGGLAVLLEKVFPELRGQSALYDQIWNDLYSRGLVDTESLHTTISQKGILASRTTKLGKAFVKFIKEPVKD